MEARHKIEILHKFRDDETVVSMVIHNGRLLVATNLRVYEVAEDADGEERLHPLILAWNET